MEGPNNQEKTIAPETRNEKMERAQISVRSMFNRGMETSGVIKRVIEDNRLSFAGQEERN
ncbi:MAG: hypothetical protein AAB350_00525 [Patescibacteria group bacterium]